MKRIFILTLLFVAAESASSQTVVGKPAFEMRGEKFGDEFVKRGTCKFGKTNGGKDGWCMEFRPEIGGVRLEYAVHNYMDKKLYQLGWSFASEYYARLADALETKYGAPDTTYTTPLQNRMGASFLNETRRWYFADGVMEIERYSSDLTKGSMNAISTEGMKANIARMEAEKRKAAADLDAPQKKR